MFVGQHVITAMRRPSKSISLTLFVGIVSFNVVLLICVVFKWTLRTHNKTASPYTYRYLNSRLHQHEFPLLCMFTTFKSDAAKMPVNMYFLHLTYSFTSIWLFFFLWLFNSLSVLMVMGAGASIPQRPWCVPSKMAAWVNL